MLSIDLNSDLGESFGPWKMGDDSAMLKIVTSANVACGFHAGDPAGILKTLKAAVQNNVTIGAHIGYRDLVGFGRRNMDPTNDELIGDVIYQIGALQGLAQSVGIKIRYVKPHGALYNTIASDHRQAQAVIDGIKAIDKNLILMGLAGSPIIEQAKKADLATIEEAFADRAYNNDGSLVSRRLEGATLHDPKIVAARMLEFVQTGTLKSIDGKTVRLNAKSICLHGDNPDAVAMAQAVRKCFEEANVTLKSFVI